MFDAAIFDLDGLLIDSAPLWARAERDVFGAVGVAVTAEGQRVTASLSTAAVTRYWFARHAWDGPSLSDVEARVVDQVGALAASEGIPMPGARSVLELCRVRRLRTAVATNAPARVCGAALAVLGSVPRFDTAVTVDDVARPKPHPDVYALAARRLGVDPARCVAFEDSPAGATAARHAGMTVVGVAAQAVDRERLRPIAQHVVATLDAIDGAALDELAALVRGAPARTAGAGPCAGCGAAGL